MFAFQFIPHITSLPSPSSLTTSISSCLSPSTHSASPQYLFSYFPPRFTFDSCSYPLQSSTPHSPSHSPQSSSQSSLWRLISHTYGHWQLKAVTSSSSVSFLCLMQAYLILSSSLHMCPVSISISIRICLLMGVISAASSCCPLLDLMFSVV